jgi:hypothetical protein
VNENIHLTETSLLRFMWHQRDRFKRGVFLAILRCLILAPCPWLFQVIIDDHVKAGNVPGIAMVALIFLGILFLHYAFSVQGAMEIARELTDLMTSVRSEIFNKLHFLNFGFLDRQKSGRLLSKYAFDTQKVEGAMTQMINQILPNTLYSLTLELHPGRPALATGHRPAFYGADFDRHPLRLPRTHPRLQRDQPGGAGKADRHRQRSHHRAAAGPQPGRREAGHRPRPRAQHGFCARPA